MKKQKNKKYLGVISVILIITFLVMVLSFILNLLKVSGQITSINNGLLETSLITVNNIFSLDGLKFLLKNIVNNYNIFEPLVILVISLICTSKLESSGILHHIFSRFEKLKTFLLTFCVLLISMLSVFFGEHSYLFLFPFIAAVYKILGRNPVVGIITVFLGITFNYGLGIFLNNDIQLMGTLTEQAAILDVDQSYRFNMLSVNYIMLVGSALLLVILSFLIEKNIMNKSKNIEKEEKEINYSKKGLIVSGIIFLVLILLIVLCILPGSSLLDQNEEIYMNKLLGPNSIIKSGFVYIILLGMLLIGTIYGKISHNYKNDVDSNYGMSLEFNNIGYVFVIMFFSSQLISILEYTNIGTLLVTWLTDLLSITQFSGLFLVLMFMIIVIIMTLLVPSLYNKWALMSPITVPLFMRANMTPEFCQFIYTVSNSIGRCFTPFFVYFLIMIGFIKKYSDSEEVVTISTVLKKIMPTILAMSGILLLFILLWYISGIPTGISGYPTL